MARILIFALLAISLSDVLGQNNCGLASCGDQEHIDCWTDENYWGETCPEDRNMLNLASVTGQIASKHNELRNRIAGGLVPGFEPAKRMGSMAWNVKLANLCRKNVRQCDTVHDGCRNVPEFDFVGQSLAYTKYPATDTGSNIDKLLDLITMWYNEIGNATMADMEQYMGDTDRGRIDHAAQLLKAYSTRVGCAASATNDGEWKTLFFCCNYDIGNIHGWPVYDKGVAASGCSSGKHTTYTNLCKLAEVFNVNAFWEDYV